MIGNYRRISPAQLQELLANPDSIGDFLYEGGDPGASHLGIEKSWHVIHFLLTGSAWEGEPPLSQAVLGGTPLGDEDLGYGPARYLKADEVQVVSRALNGISPTELGHRFDQEALAAAEIYPSIWDGAIEEDEIQAFLDDYRLVVDFFAQAAQNEEALLLYID
jgi:hypothetical protein